MALPKLESVVEFAERRPELGSAATIWRRIRNGNFPCVRIGKRVFIIERQVENWMNSGGGRCETPEQRAAQLATDPNC